MILWEPFHKKRKLLIHFNPLWSTERLQNMHSRHCVSIYYTQRVDYKCDYCFSNEETVDKTSTANFVPYF